MKRANFILAVAAASAMLSGCSAALQSTASSDDGMYGVHDKITIANHQRERAELQRAEAEARRAELEARIAEAQARILEEDYYYSYPAESYSSVLADSYESAYLRRLRGFSSPTYRLPSSYYDLRYGDAYNYVTAYDPAFYNVMVSGDQVWVEPKYISSMFGTWGATNVTLGLTISSGGWYFGWNAPYYGAWWGYPHYSWYDWNWGICYNPYNWWGWGWGPAWGPIWGPSWGHGPSHGHHWNPRPHRENIVNRPSYTSPSSGRNYGSRAVRGSINGSGVYRPSGTGSSNIGRPSNGGYRYNGSTARPSSGRTGVSGSGSVNTDRRGSSSFFNYDNNSRSNNRSNNSYDNNNSYRSQGSSSGFSGSGFSGSSGSSSGGHRNGNSLGR